MFPLPHLFLFYFFYVYEHLYVYLCNPRMSGGQEVQKESDPLELELQAVVSHCVGSGKSTWSSGRATSGLNH